MKIIVNGRFLGRTVTGVDRFGVETLKAVDDLFERQDPCVAGITFEILLPPGTIPSVQFKHLRTRSVGKHQGQLWEQLVLPHEVDKHSVLLSLCNTAPVFLRRQVVVIHDAATVSIPASFSKSFRLWYRLLMPLLGKTAKRIGTVSQFAKQELEKKFSIASSKIHVLPEGGEHVMRIEQDDTVLDRFELRRRPYVLAVSSMAVHKNFRLVLQALEQMPNAPFDVAIAGGANARVFGSAGVIDNDQIRWLGYVTDAELRALYTHAMCFVFPSVYEGFGIPPLEAMTLGCPVLASNAASIPEVCGDAALYFDPYNVKQLIESLQRIAHDPILRQTLSDQGKLQSQQFSWLDTAKQVISMCREV